MSRSRMAGIQSQPSVSAKVGPSMAMRPPFSPGPSAMRLLVRDAGVVRRRDEDGEHVVAGCEQAGDIEAAADEGAVDSAECVAVEEDLRAVVDAVEGERGMAVQRGGRSGEMRAEPEALVRERLRDRHVVQAEVGVGIDAARDQGGENGAGHDSGVPVGVVEARRGDARRRLVNRLNPRPIRQFARSVRVRWSSESSVGEMRDRMGDGLLRRSGAARQCGWVLR